MTTTEFISAPVADKHLAWITKVLAKTKFAQDYLAADISVKYKPVKGEPLDTFVVFTLDDGTVTRLSTGSGKGDLNGAVAPWRETRKAFAALVAPAAETKATVKEKPAKEEPVAEAAAPAKPKAKAAQPKAKKAKAVKKDKVLAEAEALLADEPMADPAELPPEL